MLWCVFLSPARAQAHVDIVDIYQRFLASRVAALSCNANDPETEPHFLENLTTLSIRATQALRERNPSLSEVAISDAISNSNKQIKAKVKAEIAGNGCGGEEIRQLLTLYKMHATMNLSGNADRPAGKP